MPSTWNLLKKIAENQFNRAKDSFQTSKQERVDKDLPLGLRIIGMVEIPEVDFILGGNDLRIKHPGDSAIVASYGTFPTGHSKVHRFYLNATETVYMLQIVTDDRNIIEECKLFMPYDEVYPDDWDFWLSAQDGYIGLEIFQTKDQTQYSRVWDNEDSKTVVQEDAQGNQLTRIPPVPFTEKIYLDPYGQATETVEYESMLYGRHVNENVDEYLLLSAVNEKDGASIQLMVGIALEPSSLKVI
jgi:hypothetical protein